MIERFVDGQRELSVVDAARENLSFPRVAFVILTTTVMIMITIMIMIMIT